MVAWWKIGVFQTCLLLPSCWNTVHFNQTMIIIHITNRHCHVCFHAFLGQSLTCGNSCIPKGFILFGQFFVLYQERKKYSSREKKGMLFPFYTIVMVFTKYIMQDKAVIKAKVRTQGKCYVKVKTSIQWNLALNSSLVQIALILLT